MCLTPSSPSSLLLHRRSTLAPLLSPYYSVSGASRGKRSVLPSTKEMEEGNQSFFRSFVSEEQVSRLLHPFNQEQRVSSLQLANVCVGGPAADDCSIGDRDSRGEVGSSGRGGRMQRRREELAGGWIAFPVNASQEDRGVSLLRRQQQEKMAGVLSLVRRTGNPCL